MDEETTLLKQQQQQQRNGNGNGLTPVQRRPGLRLSGHAVTQRNQSLMIVTIMMIATFLVATKSYYANTEETAASPLWGMTKHDEETEIIDIAVQHRCPTVQKRFFERDGPDVNLEFGEKYAAQATDFNVFYRATAHIFWHDYHNEWGNVTRSLLNDFEIHLLDRHIPLGPKSTWTWVTGDQHLSNFGAWQNRHGDVVFSVNDFDEAAIYDFHVDVLRIAVSICNHALANGFSPKVTKKALKIFTNSYVDAVLSYVDNEDALLFELTPETSFGVLQDFMEKVERKNSASKQLKKFTEISMTTGLRHFVKGDIGMAHEKTKLAGVPPLVAEEVKAAFSSTHYGATLMKLGWNVRQWDDDYYKVLDVAERVGSGIGSFGVSRYYVLLKGTDDLLDENNEDGSAVILDVKYEPLGAVERILSENDLAWYENMFSNPAERIVEGQRRLTSYVDPFLGYIKLKDADGDLRPFGIRQRSPWKDSIDVNTLTDPDDFNDFTSQIALSTATSHVRGSVAKAPADFKHVIEAIMKNKHNRKRWTKVVAALALKYHEQVLLDYACFDEFITETYNISASLDDGAD